MRQAKILILTVPHGTAHERLGFTLKKNLEKIRPDVVIETVNALDHCSKWFRTYYNSYQLPLRYWPALWGWIEAYQHTHTTTGPDWLYRRAASSLARLIHSYQPEVVVATEVGMCELAALIKRQAALDFRLAAVPTGIDTDRPWVQAEVDLYVVEPDQVAPFLQAQGVPSPKILDSSVPVDPDFESPLSRATLRESLGLVPHVPVVLVLFGGSGMGRPLRVMAGLKNARTRFQTVWITGRNANLRRRLERRLASSGNSRVLGWTNNMHGWMAAADLMLGKPGSGTLLEAINSGLPILAFDPLPGIERRACDLIEDWRIGRWIRHPRQIAEVIDDLLICPEKLQQLRENVLTRAHPQAAERAAGAILDLIPSGSVPLKTAVLPQKANEDHKS